MSEKKKRGKEFDNPYSVAKAVTKGNALTKLSMVVLGLGNIAHHQKIINAATKKHVATPNKSIRSELSPFVYS